MNSQSIQPRPSLPGLGHSTRTRAASGWLFTGALLAVSLTGAAFAGPVPQPTPLPVSMQGLTGWQEVYWEWAFGGITPATDSNGNAVVGNIVLMPFPSTAGDGTPGHQDATLNAGQSWVMPLWTLLGTSYTDGTPPDPFVDTSLFATLDISFQIDGQTIIDSGNVMAFFAQGTFNPPISLPSDYAPLAAIIWVEDIGIVRHPFSVGVHTMRLDVKNTLPLPPNFGGGFSEFHNTWTIRVLPLNQ